MAKHWVCHACTFENEDDEASVCMVCETARRGKQITYGNNSDVPEESHTKIDVDDIFELGNMSMSNDELFLPKKPPKSGTQNSNDSISQLAHMSFAAWEDDRGPWTCNLCTFKNEARFLICGACGVAEGAQNILEDGEVAEGLKKFELNTSQDFLTKTMNKELHQTSQKKISVEKESEDSDIKLDGENESRLARNLSEMGSGSIEEFEL
eukprot:scaffold33694_cov98-Cyclotella_meneghiniana.AAC.5